MITESVLISAINGDWRGIRAIPKTDLHAHILLSAPFSAFERISGNKVELPPKRFAGIEHFSRYLRSNIFHLFSSVSAQQSVIEACLQHMIGDGVTHAEASFELSMAIRAKIPWGKLVGELAPIINEKSDSIELTPELGVAREMLNEDTLRLVREALDTGFFKAIDLYGSESAKTLGECRGFIDEAIKRGLAVKLHLGESTSSERMSEELASVSPSAIQHGIASVGNDILLKQLSTSQVPVHVCPYSNYVLSYVESYENHPIRKMFDAGLNVTINTDDFSIFGRSLSEEYVRLYEAGVFTAEELEQIRQNGLAAVRKI